MKYRIQITAPALAALLAIIQISCSKNAPPPQSSEDDEDIINEIIGEVDEESEAESEPDKPTEVAYKGPTKLTVNLKVVNAKNPKASFKLTDSSGRNVAENKKLGEQFEVAQGAYTLEFQSPLVFGDPVYRVEDVKVEGEKATIDESFPAGQITLNTYRGNQGKCKSVSFSVKNQTGEKELPGKGKTCKPIILEAASYELLLDISKNTVQPVTVKLDREQVSSVSIELEK